MAEKLIFDSGIIELDVNGNGLLRFNPSDPNIYRRFYELAKELPEMEKRYVTTRVDDVGDADDPTMAEGVLDQLEAMDAELKRRLSEVFGAGNDFDALLGGVSLLAFGGNGEMAITNLLNALKPYIEAGVNKHTQAVAETAVHDAELNREQRRALK